MTFRQGPPKSRRYLTLILFSLFFIISSACVLDKGRVLVDGVEIWCGDASTDVITEGAHFGVYF